MNRVLFVFSLTVCLYASIAYGTLDWKIGQEATYLVKIDDIEFTEQKIVVSETATGFWLQKNRVSESTVKKFDILFDKKTGKILEIWADGKKANIPQSEPIEVIEEKSAEIKVPAGAFRCNYRKIRYTRIDFFAEIWEDRKTVPFSGLIRYRSNQLGAVITYELLSFKKL